MAESDHTNQAGRQDEEELGPVLSRVSRLPEGRLKRGIAKTASTAVLAKGALDTKDQTEAGQDLGPGVVNKDIDTGEVTAFDGRGVQVNPNTWEPLNPDTPRDNRRA